MLTGEPRLKRYLKFPYRLTKDFFASFGIDLTRIGKKNDYFSLRKRFLEDLNIDLVIDVGANKGQYATVLRNIGYEGKIVSFEPMSKMFSMLHSNSKLDSSWECFNFALGSQTTTSKMYVLEELPLSSILPNNADLKTQHSDKVLEEETIQIKTLDSVFKDLFCGGCSSSQNIWLKIDTEGFELEVLKGAEELLEKVKILDVEVCFQERKRGQSLVFEINDFLRSKGFQLFTFGPLHINYLNGQVLDTDALYLRGASASSR